MSSYGSGSLKGIMILFTSLEMGMNYVMVNIRFHRFNSVYLAIW
jgi:hypothetical protein